MRDEQGATGFVSDGVCERCGHPLEGHDRHVRFRLPDPLVGAFEPDAAGVWMTHPDPLEAVMMQVPGAGAFVRALLPVGLEGGFTVTFGVWVGVHPDDLRRAFDVWWDEPAYAALTLDGRLANVIGRWDVLGASVRLAVRATGETPYCDSSADELLQRILTESWPHDAVLPTLSA